MSYYKIEPTNEELVKWSNNRLINPRTGRKITKQGKIYKLLDQIYNSKDLPKPIEIIDTYSQFRNKNIDPILLESLPMFHPCNNLAQCRFTSVCTIKPSAEAMPSQLMIRIFFSAAFISSLNVLLFWLTHHLNILLLKLFDFFHNLCIFSKLSISLEMYSLLIFSILGF